MLYTNSILTVIAALLAVIAFRPTPPSPERLADEPRTLDVNIVGSTKSLPVSVDFAGLRNTPLEVTIAGASKEVPVTIVDGLKPEGPLDVKLVGSSVELPVLVKNPMDKVAELKGPLDINIVSVGGDTLSRVGSKTVLPVGVHNTVDVDVKGLNGNTMRSSMTSSGRGAAGFPVVILNQ